MKIQMNTEVGPFEGAPTAAQLTDVLGRLPGEAFVRLETWDSQRDGDGWRLKAHWTEQR